MNIVLRTFWFALDRDAVDSEGKPHLNSKVSEFEHHGKLEVHIGHPPCLGPALPPKLEVPVPRSSALLKSVGT